MSSTRPGVRRQDGARHPSRSTRGLAAALACVTTAGLGLAVATSAPSVAAGGHDRATSPYAMKALAYGSRVTQGDLQASSARTGLVAVSCTSRGGVDRSRGVETGDLDDNGSIDGVVTRVWTTRTDGVVASHARSRVAAVDIGNELGSLGLANLVVSTRTWHDANGFHRRHTFDLGGLTAELAGIPLPDLPAPDEIEPGQTLEIPGVATLTFDKRAGKVGNTSATAMSTGLTVDIADGTHAVTAVAESSIGSGATGGLLSGKAESAHSSDGLLLAHNVVKKSIPCTGTDGEWRNATGVGVEQPGVETGDATVGALGNQLGGGHAVARTRAQTTRIALGGSQLVLRAIKSQANVVRDGGSYTRTAKGSSIGRLLVNGEPQEAPDPGEDLTIPGLATITPQVVTRTARSISVVGLRIELLGGSDAGTVLEIAKSFAQIKPR